MIFFDLGGNIGSMGLVYLSIHLVDLYGKCRFNSTIHG